jgi:hypothetical protein
VDIIALVLGILTAGIGAGLLITLSRTGAPAQSQAAPDPARPGLRPLVEFFHPVLAVVALACLFGLAYIGDRGFAVAAFWVLVVTASGGMTLLSLNVRDAGTPGTARKAAPLRLIALHGLGAACVLTLAALRAFGVL